MSRYYVILNPIAGKGNGEHVRPQIEKTLTELGLDYKLVETERPGHATPLTKVGAGEGFDVIVAAGGDGTANEVLNGIMELGDSGKKMPLMAVLPVGRGNDFAYGMGIPVGVDESCKLLANDPRVKIDVGRVKSELFPNGLYFGNGVGMGFDAVVGFVAAKMKIGGILSYLVAAIKTMFIYFHAPKINLDLDGKVQTLNPLLVSIMNGRRMGGSFMMAPQSKHNDGVFDLCVVKEVSRGKIVSLMGLIMKGTQATDPAVSVPQAKKIKITAVEGTLPAHADGVTLCEAGKEISIEILPEALTIITRSQL
jgi:YegS/Rv2252/BmrU family lipid kinase